MRVVAIGLMCGAMLCFTGLDTSSKWLGRSLPVAEIVWSRYLGAGFIALAVARPWSRSGAPRSNTLCHTVMKVSGTAAASTILRPETGSV